MSTTTQIRNTMISLVDQGIALDLDAPDNNFVNLTELAEAAAHELGHDEWLDDETHEVWDIAITVAEKADPERPR